MTNISHKDPDDLEPHPKNDEVYGDEQLPEEFVQSIRRHGVREPLVVTPKGRIISGHRRWQAAQEIGLGEVPTIVESYGSDLDEWEALVDYNRQRKKTPGQLVNEAELLMKVERKRAEERNAVTAGDNPSQEKLPDTAKGQARDKVGEQLDKSGRTIEKGLRVKEKAEAGDETAQEAWEEMQEGDESIHGAYEKVRESQSGDDDGSDAPSDDFGPETYTCTVCGDGWEEWDLSGKEGTSVAVEKVCVVEYPDDFVFHFEGDVP